MKWVKSSKNFSRENVTKAISNWFDDITVLDNIKGLEIRNNGFCFLLQII